MRRNAIVALAAAALVLPLLAQARAAEHSGTVVAVVPASEASGSAGRRMLVISGPVFQGDVISTAGAGEAQIRLDDNTKLVVGPNSRLVVDEYVYDSKTTAKKVSLSALRGAFRFITGSSRKSAYEITTPTATIGVRGTEFDFSVTSGGELNLALFSGEARICQPGRRCVVVSGACSVVVANRARPLRQLATDERRRILETRFPYVASQARLRQDFRVDSSNCETRRAALPAPENTGSIVPPGLPVGAPPPPPPPPPPEPSGPTNHNGFADGTNPGQGAAHNNSSSGGSQNPGGGNH
jgi:ferric-dicitrate binding protein FerR (iron transport regulator)